MCKKYLVFIFLFSINFCAFAQPSVLYSSINTTARVPLTNMGLFLQGRMQANQSGYQRWAFHVGTVSSPDYSQNWRIGSTPNALTFSNFLQAGYSNGANYFTGGSGVDGELNSAVIGNYYTFNIMKNAFASNDMEVIETNFNPTIISTVVQSPLAANVVANTSVAVTITLVSAPSAGELVYLRYSIDGFANSSLIQASLTGNTSTVNIPCQAAGTALSYYVFTSTETLAGINSDVIAFGVNSYDLATLNVNNNGGPNYSYTVNAAPTNIISYGGSPYCSNAGTAAITNTGTLGGVYSSTAGLSINAATGAINLATSAADTYMVTYSIAAAGSCALFTATTMVTITAAPSATISYTGSPYCSSTATALVTRIGTAGGTYSSTAGLNLNTTTGDINIATSTAGTYTVTYAILAAAGCAAFTTTSTITITAAPSATISYTGSPYCNSTATALVTRTGTIGGTFTSTPSLNINATTGEINIGTSTAGIYTVTYTIAAASGCPTFTTTAPITITAAPTATISYLGSPYCGSVATALVTRVGSAGGTYSSTPGLTLNATTGEINIGTSTAGTYSVTYTIAAAAGCALFTTTTPITITAAPTATISFGNLPYCSNSGTATVIRTGTTGGTYSSTTGLSINATTGIVTLGTSTAGTYTVTYTIAAANGCPSFTTTAPITITTAPSATITYAGSPYCSNTTTALVTRVGSIGGTYSSTLGLTINVTTGEINIGTSTAGTYTVTYTIAATAGCALFTTTAPITITAAPAATINYGGLPFCSNSGTATVIRTGTTGGTYSSSAGLSLNATTGAVTLGTSTAGTYTVTYTVGAASGCPIFTTTTAITITAAPSATINYSGSPYCSNATTATITRTGTTGGSYSSTTGLVINAITGDVDIANSIVGTYIVTYTIAANAGCAIYTTTTTITINTISVAPTSALASTALICGNNGTINLTANGGTAGTGGLYKWYSGSCGGTLIGTGSTLNNVTLNTTTTYFVRIEGACNNTSCQSVTVIVAPKPVVEITVAPPGGLTPTKPSTVIATVSPPDNYTYVWTKNNTLNLNINRDRIVVIANEAGDYNVKVIAPSGCTSTSVNAFVPSAVSTTLFIFPNPNNGLFNVSYNNGLANLNGRTINIYDSKAARVFTQTYNNAVPYSNMKVDMRGFAKGLYFVILRDNIGKELATGKVLIL